MTRSPLVLHRIAEVREHIARTRAAVDAGPVVLVPTMGALHEGHLTHVRRARESAGLVVVSIFVNPLQFGANEDLDRYPRTLDADLAALAEVGADVVFAPDVAEMYPDGPAETRVTGGAVAGLFEGASRPGHFDGMLTVVAKLLAIVSPDVVSFGQKDAQQVFLVRRMIRDLDIPVRVRVIDTVREPDGLALSSRNRYLGGAERVAAGVLSAALRAAADAAGDGVRAATAAAHAVLDAEGLVELDYFAVVDPGTFLPVHDDHRGAAQALIAARLGTTRLIDNATIDVARRNPHMTLSSSAPTPPDGATAELDGAEPGEAVAEQKAVRLAKRERLIASGAEAYPVAVPVTTTIAAVRAEFGELEPDTATGTTVGVAGRVVHLRNTGKLCFASLQAGDGSRIQAMVSLAAVGAESLAEWKDLVDLGDHLFVAGEVISSRRGELSIMATEWKIAAKALLPLPNLHTELSDETRVRSRYLDLIVRDQARANVLNRAKTVASLRRSFAEADFVEVETPMLQVMHGGASARPFVTHSNAFDTDLYLRIAPELYLKRAVVGGIDRVFEINRNFRNEGADSTHSPEFAMLEAYEAYGDYLSIADLTQRLIQDAALAVAGSHVVTWADGEQYDLGGDWDRISMYESLSAAADETITPATTVEQLQALADREGVEVHLANHGKLVEELWEHFVKDGLERPTFVLDFPVETSPLVRAHRNIDGVVEKWDLYIRGFELATGYSELVDPVVQRERFVQQARQGARGDLDAMPLDEDFLRALEHGMPPCGGMGMGIDRLLMALSGLGIRETILFPLVK